MKEIETWQNGKWTPNSKASIPIWDAHVFFGWAVFDALRTYRHKVFLAEEHVDRFFKSAALADIPLADKYTRDEVEHLIYETLDHNKEFFPSDEEYRIMIFASPGYFKIYQDVAGYTDFRLTINVTTVSRYASHIAPYLERGFRGIIVSQPQIPTRFLDPKIKSCSRLHLGIADSEAARFGNGAIPILLNNCGGIAESTGGNIAFFKDFKVCMPRHNVLEGCTMKFIEKICKGLKYEIVKSNWDPYDLINSDGAMFTSTFYGIIPCSSVNYRGKEYDIINGRGGRFLVGIMRAFNELVNVNTQKQWEDWYARLGNSNTGERK